MAEVSRERQHEHDGERAQHREREQSRDPRTEPATRWRRRRLLFVGTHRGIGGTECHFVTLARALADAGHEVAAAVWPGDFIHDALAADGRIELFPARFQSRNDTGAMRDVMRIARTLRPDWMVGAFKGEYWPLAVAGKLLRVPLVLFMHQDQRMQPIMLRGLPRLVHRMVAPSEYLRERMIARGVPASRVAVLHNPFDTSHYRVDPAVRREARARLGFAPGDVVVGFVGRIEPEKGVHTLAAALDGAMSDHPQLRALWVGDGRSAAELRSQVAGTAHAARHAWQPWTPDVFPCFAAMDMLALPSSGSETFGRVLAEAQACGVPVLGSARGGIPEAMQPGVSGLLVPADDVDAWRRAVTRLAADPLLRRRMGRAGRQFVVERFDAPRIAHDFERLIGCAAG